MVCNTCISTHGPPSFVQLTSDAASTCIHTCNKINHHPTRDIYLPVQPFCGSQSTITYPVLNMPSLPMPRFLESTLNSQNTHARRTPSNNDSTRIWIIIAAVAAILALGACIALLILSISKRRLIKQQLEEARLKDPCLGQKEFSRMRRMTIEDRVMEAEEQREAMIRKSLASRSSRSVSMSSRWTLDQTSMVERPESYSAHTLRDDKELEMRLSRPTSISSLQRARSKSPFPDLPPPTLSRSSSPSRLSLLAGRVELPPLLENHPCLRDNSGLEDEPKP